MKFLTDLNPKWLGRLRRNSGEGIEFECPTCGPTHQIVAYFSNPADKFPAADWSEMQWTREGDDFNQLTISPSMHYPCWHGWIEEGRVFSIAESPITVVMLVNETQQIVALSPKQTLLVARQVSEKATKQLYE